MAALPEVSAPPLRSRVALLLSSGLLAATTVNVVTADLHGNSALTGTSLSWFILLALGIAILSAAITAAKSFLWWPLALLMGLYCAACATLSVVRQLPWVKWADIEFVLAAPRDSLKTFVEMGGPPAITAAIAVALLAALGFGASLVTVSRRFARSGSPRRLLLLAALLAANLVYSGAPHDRLSRYPKAYLLEGSVARSILPVVATPQYQPFTNGEDVFFVQMESINGLAVNGDYVVDGKRVTGEFLPGMHRLAQKGISIPYFWSNEILTHRAQQSILCGVARNIYIPYFDELAPRTSDCLPELFQRAGYRTIFLSNYWDGGFSSTSAFMRRIGFRDLHFADFMKKGDRISVWGYDEKAFFDRAFDYLQSRYRRDEKLFVYLAISTHHAGFTRERRSDLYWFQEDLATRMRQYLESARVQDESLLTFHRRFEQFTDGDAHAFLVTDHGFPLGLYGAVLPNSGATIDNYLAPFLYIPPARRAGEFALGRTIDAMYGQTDLMPTIAELLSGRPHQNSFVPFMKRDRPQRVDYEPCHVMVQPLDGRTIVIAREQNLYEYSLVKKVLREYRITPRPMRQTLVSQRENVSYDEFDRLYGCSRFRPVTQTTASARRPAAITSRNTS